MVGNLKLTLIGPAEAVDLQGILVRFENEGTSPLAVIRCYRPGFYAGYRVEVKDSCGQIFGENRNVPACGTPYPLTEDALVVLPPGGSHEAAVDLRGYDLPPSRYLLRVTYATHEVWLNQVTRKPAGLEHLARGEWASNWIRVVLTK